MTGPGDALRRFDAAQGVQFETFATQRIRGAMLDGLRGNDWTSHGDRHHQRSNLKEIAGSNREGRRCGAEERQGASGPLVR